MRGDERGKRRGGRRGTSVEETENGGKRRGRRRNAEGTRPVVERARAAWSCENTGAGVLEEEVEVQARVCGAQRREFCGL